MQIFMFQEIEILFRISPSTNFFCVWTVFGSRKSKALHISRFSGQGEITMTVFLQIFIDPKVSVKLFLMKKKTAGSLIYRRVP